MANIRKLGQSWQARVRRRGFPDETKSFPTKAEAERWARSIEGEMDRGEFVSRTEAEQTTFGEVIKRYMGTITPKKRGHVEETIRLTATLRHRIAKLSMANLTPQAIADFRDDRLSTCKANTVIRDLAFEDFGGYCQRTGENCAAASFRETERKLAKARIRRYQFLPGIRVEERIPEVILRTCGNARITDEVRGSRGKEQYSNPAELWKMNASTP